MAKIAIIGTGIAGLGCAHFLHREHELTLFEQNTYAGGHTNTVTVNEPSTGRRVPIDTGFMVFNHVTYPLLTRLFRDLGVPTKPTSMSFSVCTLDRSVMRTSSGVCSGCTASTPWSMPPTNQWRSRAWMPKSCCKSPRAKTSAVEV
jgi:predicted NAD/FAD-binding protein